MSRELRAAWDALADSEGARFTYHPAFVGATARMRDATPRVTTVRSAGRLRVVAAFVEKRVGRYRVARLPGRGLATASGVLAYDRVPARALLRHLERRRTLVHADAVPAEGVFLAVLREDADWLVRTLPFDTVPVLDLTPGATARDVRSARSLRRLRKSRSASARAGAPIEIVEVRTRDELAQRWPAMCAIAEIRCGTKPDRRNFLAGGLATAVFETLAEEADAGRLRVVGITAGGRWIAHEIAIQTGSTWEGWLTHHDPAFRSLQPGHQLLEWIVDNSERLGVARIDHGTGVNDVKSAWSTGSYELVTVFAAPRTVALRRPLVWGAMRISPTRLALEGLREHARRVVRFRREA